MKTRPWISVSELAQPSDPDAQSVVDAASQILFVLSGQKYGGLFETTEQYYVESTGAPVGCYWDSGEKAYWNPFIGVWAYTHDPVGRKNRLVPGDAIRLRNPNVVSITSISVGGSAVDPSEYELVNASIVRRTNLASWSIVSNPVITYVSGVEPPALGKLACRKLADELMLAIQGAECNLPTNVTSISRQGMSLQIIDPQAFLDKGRLGIYEVDLFLTVANPGKAKKRPRVFSPDMRHPYRRT